MMHPKPAAWVFIAVECLTLVSLYLTRDNLPPMLDPNAMLTALLVFAAWSAGWTLALFRRFRRP